MSLLDLPPETLALIVRTITSQDVGCLWMCGTKLLMAKLCGGFAVTEWIYISSGLRFFHWPRLLSEFTRLVSISIRDSTVASSTIIKKEDVAYLARSLEFLQLEVYGSFWAFQHALRDQPSIFPNLSSLVILDNHIDNLQFTQSPLVWPSSLTCLDLRTSMRQIELKLADIPQSLITLCGRFGSFQGSRSEGFPQSLKKMEIQLPKLSSDFCALLPPNLTHLQIRTHSDIGNEWNWHEVPQGLQYLHVGKLKVVNADIARLPKSLTHLEVADSRDIDVNFLQYFPPGITHVGGLFPAFLEPDYSKYLPRTLQRLDSKIAVAALHSIPKSLTVLHIARPSYHLRVQPTISSTEMKQFDRILSSLPLKKMFIETKIELLDLSLPSTLTQLTVFYHTLKPATLRSLPESITLLETGYALPSGKSFKDLPPHLISLNSGFLRWHDEKTHPSNYSYLYHDSEAEVIIELGPQCASFFPKWLKNLSLASIALSSAEWFSDLPATLETLELSLNNCISLSLKTMKLPPNLTKLRLKFDEDPTGSISPILMALPRSINALGVAIGAHNEKQSEISDEDLNNLPPNIVSMRLPTTSNPSKLTGRCTTHFPRSLIIFHLGEKEPGWFASYRRNPNTLTSSSSKGKDGTSSQRSSKMKKNKR
jgi:hypothetical protein